MKFYAVAEDFGQHAEEAERVLNQILFDADADTWGRLKQEAQDADHMASLGGAAFTPIMDDFVKQAEDEIFSTWAKRPTSGHSLRIAWDDEP